MTRCMKNGPPPRLREGKAKGNQRPDDEEVPERPEPPPPPPTRVQELNWPFTKKGTPVRDPAKTEELLSRIHDDVAKLIYAVLSDDRRQMLIESDRINQYCPTISKHLGKS